MVAAVFLSPSVGEEQGSSKSLSLEAGLVLCFLGLLSKILHSLILINTTTIHTLTV